MFGWFRKKPVQPTVRHIPGYRPSRQITDDDRAMTGSAVVDGVLGLPSSPTALAVDLATHSGFDVSTYDSVSTDSGGSSDNSGGGGW